MKQIATYEELIKAAERSIAEERAAKVCSRASGNLFLGLSLTSFEPQAFTVFTRFAYRPSSQTARWKRSMVPPLHE